ncbi:transketolase [Catellatospora methionotrophica]|uniref:transketolase n=1 Tax=Catellatospora methionotrophica TaxID=121620 RepID=UPI0034078CF7
MTTSAHPAALQSTESAASSTVDPAPAVAHAARHRLLTLAGSQSVHLGSSLSVVDILVAVYRETGLTAATLEDNGRDRIILSKGHAVWAMYAVLASLGICQFNDDLALPGHPADGTPGVDVATGALGHGPSIAAGLVEAGRLTGHDRRVFVIVGDGELNEGSVWEAAMFAAHRRLGRLVIIVDLNGLQQEGRTCDVLDLAPLEDKWRAFGWHVATVDGHDHDALALCLQQTRIDDNQPTVVLARTVKGKGVRFMEHDPRWHVARLSPTQLASALHLLSDSAVTGA